MDIVERTLGSVLKTVLLIRMEEIIEDQLIINFCFIKRFMALLISGNNCERREHGLEEAILINK